MKMNYHTRKWIKPEDLNANYTLLRQIESKWIDEDFVRLIIQLENPKTSYQIHF